MAGRAETSWISDPDIRAALQEIDDALGRAVQASESSLDELARHLVALGGKRLRPGLLLVTHGCATDRAAIVAGTAVELIHVASLYHDDVMDRSILRRGSPTANARYGSRVAAVGGTYLFTRAAMMLASLGDTAARLGLEAAARLCRGQLAESENAFNLELAPERHLEIIRLKTASLFELPVQLGASLRYADGPTHAALTSYGTHLGLAFQLRDDLMDLAGDAAIMGKEPGSDLRSGIYSLAVLRLLNAPGSASTRLSLILRKRGISDRDLAEACGLVRDSGAIDEVEEDARREAALAIAALEPLDDGPLKKSLDALARLAADRPT